MDVLMNFKMAMNVRNNRALHFLNNKKTGKPLPYILPFSQCCSAPDVPDRRTDGIGLAENTKVL